MTTHQRALVFLALILVPGVVSAQIPDEFTNLKVLPQDIAKGELVDVMRGFAGGLGVRCSHCHVGPDNLQGMDFATDEKRTKRAARAMMRMVDSINGTHLEAIEFGRDTRTEVRCRTCHHGLHVPAAIGDVVARTVEADGVDAAIARYRELRDEHHGGDAYDFSPGPLNSLSETTARAGRLDDALALVRLNVEYHPDDSYTRMVLGGIHAAREEYPQAVAAFEKAVELDPSNTWAGRQLERLRSASEPDE